MPRTTAKLLRSLAVLWCAGIATSSCGDSPGAVGEPGDNGNSGGIGGTTVNLTGKGGAISGAGGSTAPSSNAGTCGTTTKNTARALADVLIVLDRSSSMTWSLTADVTCDGRDPSCSDRLSAVVAGVSAVVTDNPDVRWGLEFFSSPNTQTCRVNSAPQVPIGDGTGNAIKAQLASMTTSNSTPTAAALTAATNYLKTVNDGNNKVILLATDGLPNCANGQSGADDLPGAIAAAGSAKSAGFPVYVIGIGPSVSNLNGLAESGGTGQYYPATSTAELNAALASIAQVVSATCSYKASDAPPDKNLVYVYVDKQLVERGANDGWVPDPADPSGATVQLTGKYCNDILAGKATQVQIVFGCPNVPPPDIIP